MADTVATLVVELIAKDPGLAAKLREAEAGLKATDAEARRTQTSLAALKGDGGAGMLRLAQARARLQVASGDAAGAERTLAAALAQVDRTTAQTIGAQTQLVGIQNKLKASADGAKGGATGLVSSLQGLAGAAAAAGVGLSTVVTVVSSFADAFKFKAELDASRASVAVLLDGVRDVPTTFAEASAYAQDFKLTQQELATAMNASAGIMRNSTAPIGDILNVMQRLTVLNPKENIEGAAFALKELQSGDITSIAERFNISRQAANQMKLEILAGGDAVKILDQYLTSVGATSQALTAQLDGPVGKMKDLALAQEELKLAQGEFATGPGLLALEGQINVTRGATRLLTGDFADLSAAAQQNSSVLNTQAGILGIAANFGIQRAQAAQAQAAAEREAAAAAQEAATATQTSAQADVAGYAAASQYAAGLQEEVSALNQSAADKVSASLASQELAATTGALTAAVEEAAASQLSAADAAALIAAQFSGVEAPAIAELITRQRELGTSTYDSITAQIEQQTQAELLAQKHDALAQAIEAAAASGASAESAAAAIASQFSGVEAPAVINLINLHRELAAARAQAAGPATGALGSIMASKPGRPSAIAGRFAPPQLKVPRTGGGGRAGGGSGGGGVSAAQKAADKAAKAEAKEEERRVKDHERTLQQLVDLEERYGEEQAKIREDFAKRMADAEQEFGDQQIQGRADFYAALAGIEDQAIRRNASAEFEAAAQKAAEIAKTKGADVAAAYEEESAKIIEAQARRQEEIKKLQEDGKKDEAAYLEGVDQLQRDAEQRRLDRIAQGADSLQTQQTEALNQAQQDFADKQADILGGTTSIADAERARLDTMLQQTEQLRQQAALQGGSGAALPPTASAPRTGPAGAPSASGTATTTTTTPADAASLGAVVAVMQDAVARLAAIQAATDNKGIISAVNGLKGSGAFLP